MKILEIDDLSSQGEKRDVTLGSNMMPGNLSIDTTSLSQPWNSSQQSQVMLSGEAMTGKGKHVKKASRTVQIGSDGYGSIQLARSTMLEMIVLGNYLSIDITKQMRRVYRSKF